MDGKGKEGEDFSGVIVNFMYQLGRAMVPSNVVKYYSRCFHERVFQKRITFK